MSGTSTSPALFRLGRLLRACEPLERGVVSLVGAGPGDPGLLTIKAARRLGEADVVYHDALVSDEILTLCTPGARLVPVGKRRGAVTMPQEAIVDAMAQDAARGLAVVRLKGGDPFVFARGGEEAAALAAAGVPFRIVPGVTAGLAALAAAQIPATLRGVNRAVIFAAGYGADADGAPDWAALARTGEPIVLYMATRNLAEIAQALMAGGLASHTPAAAIAAATTAEERILVSTLDRIAADAQTHGIAAPAIVVIGDIVTAREKLRAVAAAEPSR